MSGQLRDKVAIVTGSGHGIGRSLVLAMAKEGAKIVTNDIKSERAEKVAKEIFEMGGTAIPFTCDIANFKATRNLIQKALDEFGRMDILVNNAGIDRPHMIWKMTEEEWDIVIATHLKGTYNCTHHASIFMREQKWGRILNVTSSARLGMSGDAAYSAAKAGIIGLTRTVALDMGRYGVTCNCFSPTADTTAGGMTDLATLTASLERQYQMGLVTEKEYRKLMNMPNSDVIPPLPIYLCTDEAAAINGQVFGIYGNSIAIYEEGVEKRTIWKKGDLWTVEELKEYVPSILMEGIPKIQSM
ncbi:MAG: hypothetical protein A2157_19175 [Deltaproteobacteria bacterium RBG_16_47_11]|nr:MAG: hypothetical protein A2157_19175 [Deltaproteobacteria bacterium RBG_16_47_11]